MKPILIAACAVLLGLPGPARAFADRSAQSQRLSPLGGGVDDPAVEKARSIIRDWPADSQNAAGAMIDKYGVPDLAGGTMLVWRDREPFNRIVAFRDPVKHMFPFEHNDVLLEEVRLKVPLDKVAEVLRFDGSLLIDRTRGTVASRADKESNNLIALNVANDIIQGKRDVESARRFTSDTQALALSGKSSAYAEKLQFEPKLDTAEPDVSLRLNVPR
jgi:hypothetical protein